MQQFINKERNIMQLLTNVTFKGMSFIDENKLLNINAECEAIRANYDLKLEYDGRDVFITFPPYSRIEVTKWCQLLLGLFHQQSNFKQLLSKEYPFLRCKKKVECIFFEVHSAIICVRENSNPYELMRHHFSELGYVVFNTDTECQIKTRNENLLKLYNFIYQMYLQENTVSDSKVKKHVFFLTTEEEQAYYMKEKQINNKRFEEYLQNFELDSKSSNESKELLILLKKKLLH